MRIATSEGLLSWTYVLREAPSAPGLATVEMKAFETSGTITIADVVYAFKQIDFFGRRVTFSFEGVELARAVRKSSWTSKTTVTFSPDGLEMPTLRLTPLGAFQVGFKIRDEDGTLLGRIQRKGALTTRFHVHLPNTIPLAVQGFLVALAMIDLRRRQSS